MHPQHALQPADVGKAKKTLYQLQHQACSTSDQPGKQPKMHKSHLKMLEDDATLVKEGQDALKEATTQF